MFSDLWSVGILRFFCKEEENCQICRICHKITIIGRAGPLIKAHFTDIMLFSTIQSIVHQVLYIRNGVQNNYSGNEPIKHSRVNCVKSVLSIRKNAPYVVVILTIMAVSSCTALRPAEPDEPDIILEEWVVPGGPIQMLRELTWDLHHQKLRVRFQFEKEQVIGSTEMLFSSEKNQSELVFDAKTMKFDSIYDARTDHVFEYVQDSAIVTVNLDREYASGDTLVLGISFVSEPPRRGLYFINPRGEDPVKPTQIWTLGQPEDNSFWFPTIDHPAERATQETWISVPDHFQTLSNGLLIESRIMPGDSLRTDYWRLNQPHAPYLFVLAVGEYEIIEEKKGDIIYRYYIESDFVNYVSDIYKNTHHMIRYTEEVTGVPYPWDPVYAQAPVHDFIARGMENTTATLLYDAVQFDKRAAQDLSNQDLIMHEIVHQWFGNLVTCKDWANLPLNEGFANYFESAYRQYNDGQDEYLWKNHNDRILYFEEAGLYRRPLIFFQYQIPEDMYDRHTYQKGGQVLRMLHDYLGDDLWWEGVHLWLERHAFEAVDVFDLQSVFQDVSNRDLSFFINQWFLEPGHPYLEVSHEIFGERAVLNINQIHDTNRQPIFTLYPEVLIKYENGSKRERIQIDEIQNEYLFEANRNIIDIVVDPERVQLAQYFRDISLSTLMRRLRSEHLLVRIEALSMAGDFIEYRTVRNRINEMAKNDPFWGVRLSAYGLISDFSAAFDPDEAMELAFHATYYNEKNYQVRQRAMDILRNMESIDSVYMEYIKNHLVQMMADPSYFAAANAIVAAGELFPHDVAKMVEPYAGMDSYQGEVKNAVAMALSESLSAHQEKISANDMHLHILLGYASEPGDKVYSYVALSHLLENAEKIEKKDHERIAKLFINRLNDPYKRYRLLALEGLTRYGTADHLDLLYDILEESDLQADERSALKGAIRIIEYNDRFVD